MKAVNASPQWKHGRFRNSLDRQDAPFLKSFTSWARGAEHTAPDAPPAIEARGRGDFREVPGGLSITWLGHSTSLVEIDGSGCCSTRSGATARPPFPWAGPKRFHPPPLPLPELPPIDAVVISHDHYDHLDHRTIVSLRDRAPLFVVPLGVGAHLEKWGISPVVQHAP